MNSGGNVVGLHPIEGRVDDVVVVLARGKVRMVEDLRQRDCRCHYEIFDV